jgi:hypothetical protein
MRILSVILLLSFVAYAEKHVGPVSSEDEYLVLTAAAVTDHKAVADVLGRDPGMDLILVEVTVAPRGENKIKVDFDDFTLISRKDGQRSQPFAPAQIAGKGALVVVQGGQGGGGGGLMNGSRGPIWGGVPGTNTRPHRVGGDGEAAAVSGPTESKSSLDTGSKEEENPLLLILKEKVIPQQVTNEPVTGLLYFFLEGKHKLKDLELIYKSPAGRMILDFEK